MDLIQHLYRQRDFSKATFGPGERTEGLLDHIRKELHEVAANPRDLQEWVDVIILALDGAWRVGYEPEEIAEAITKKQIVNELRDWPDWRKAEPGKAIEHIRTYSGPIPTEYDWPGDWPYENGEYSCKCGKCEVEFIGHKRRVLCRKCSVGES